MSIHVAFFAKILYVKGFKAPKLGLIFFCIDIVYFDRISSLTQHMEKYGTFSVDSEQDDFRPVSKPILETCQVRVEMISP